MRNMENTTPIIVNAMWVGLILYAVNKYEHQFKAVLNALVLRIESGSEVKVGPVQVGPLVRPQTAAEQLQKLGEEIAEPSPDGAPIETTELPAERISSTVEAEDLAFRALQSELGEVIHRNVKVNDVPVDGVVATTDGRIYVYEVKHFRSVPTEKILKKQLNQVRRTLEKIAATYEARNRGRITGVCVFVVDAVPDPAPTDMLRQLAASQEHPIQTRVFFLSELRSLLTF